MNYKFGQLFYQSLILSVFNRSGQCEKFEYDLELDLVRLENPEAEWESILLSKYEGSHTFTFNNDQLRQTCDVVFPSSDVEIVELFDTTMRLFLKRKTSDALFMKIIFSAKSSAQQFFKDIRSQQSQGSDTALLAHPIGKMFLYQMDDREDNESTLQLLATHIALRSKDLKIDWSADTKSFSFLCYESDGKFEVHLVLLSKTFNISKKTNKNIYVLCAATIPTYGFILYFHNRLHSDDFYAFIENHLDEHLPCEADNIIKYNLTRFVNSRKSGRSDVFYD